MGYTVSEEICGSDSEAQVGLLVSLVMGAEARLMIVQQELVLVFSL
jgi:hypothetical protein